VGIILGFPKETMNQRLCTVILLLFMATLCLSPSGAQNPFVSKPEKQKPTSAPTMKSRVFLKIQMWQHALKEKMSGLVHEAKATGSLRPLALLFLAAFAYGAIHAAGPGHGKAIALSYILSQRPTWFQGLLFSHSLALFHGASGILFVLAIRILLHQSVSKNLESVTHMTQIVSFSLVFCLGVWLVVKSVVGLLRRKNGQDPGMHETGAKRHFGPILSALVVGMIPCSGVVMVMLFAMSLDLIVLGVALGVTISLGMALTVSVVVLMAMSGKAVSVSVASKHGTLLTYVESSIEIVAGLALAILGLLFLGANLQSISFG
jgi:ABC-type nickel/cobalt efflux system permease component RcnA